MGRGLPVGAYLSSRPWAWRACRHRDHRAGADRDGPARDRPCERGDGCHPSRPSLCQVGPGHRRLGYLRQGCRHAALAMPWRRPSRRGGHTCRGQFLDFHRDAGRNDHPDPCCQRRRLSHTFGKDRRKRPRSRHRADERHIHRPAFRRKCDIRRQPRLAAGHRHPRAEQRRLARLG